MLANQSHPTPPNLINQRLTNLVEEAKFVWPKFYSTYASFEHDTKPRDLSIYGFMHDFKQFQSPIWRTLDRKTTQIWWLANMEYEHSKLWLLCCCFWCVVWCFVLTSAHPLFFWTNGLVQIYINVNSNYEQLCGPHHCVSFYWIKIRLSFLLLM